METMQTCFTDLSAGAGWRSTWLLSHPWQSVPPYTQLYGFCTTMVYPDLLHVFNLGIARDAAGSILKKLIQCQTVFTANTIDERLAQATVSLKQFARAHGYDLRMKKLTRNKINWGGKKYPELMSSGSDTRVVCNWLEELLIPYSGTSSGFAAYCTLLWYGNQCVRVLYACDRWFLDDQEKNTVSVLGSLYAQTFICLAWNAVSSHQLLFRVKPKLHMFVHIVEHPRRVNASRYSTWMDEDFLKKISKTLNLTSAKTAQVRILQRWLLSIPLNLERERVRSGT